MYQIVNTLKSHNFIAINTSTGAEATVLTEPVCSYRIDNGEVVTPYTFVISALDATMKSFSIAVPATLAATVGSSIEIFITAAEGDARLFIDVIPDFSLLATASVLGGIVTTLATPANFMADVSALATSAEITGLNDLSQADVVTALGTYTAPTKAELDSSTASIKGTGTETLDTIATVIGGIITEQIIPPECYTLDASEKTITLTTPCDSTTVEQVISIYNLTTGTEIYNYLNPRKRRMFMTAPEDQAGIDITVSSGVITYIETSTMADTDKIMIIVNLASTATPSSLDGGTP